MPGEVRQAADERALVLAQFGFDRFRRGRHVQALRLGPTLQSGEEASGSCGIGDRG